MIPAHSTTKEADRPPNLPLPLTPFKEPAGLLPRDQAKAPVTCSHSQPCLISCWPLFLLSISIDQRVQGPPVDNKNIPHLVCIPPLEATQQHTYSVSCTRDPIGLKAFNLFSSTNSNFSNTFTQELSPPCSPSCIIIL